MFFYYIIVNLLNTRLWLVKALSSVCVGPVGSDITGLTFGRRHANEVGHDNVLPHYSIFCLCFGTSMKRMAPACTAMNTAGAIGQKRRPPLPPTLTDTKQH